MKEGTVNEYYYGTKITAYITCAIQVIILIVDVIQFQFSNMLNILKIQLIIHCILHSITFCFPFYTDNISFGCSVQTFLYFCSVLFASITVITISFLNIKLFTNTEQYEKNKAKIITIHFLICYVVPIIICIILFQIGEINKDGLNFCYFSDNLSYYCDLVLNFLLFLSNIFFYFKLKKELKLYLKESKKEEMYKEYSAILTKLAVFIILGIIIIILNGITFSILNKEDGYQLVIKKIVDILECLYSLITTFIFCINQNVINKIQQVICCCCKKKGNNDTNLMNSLCEIS